MTDSGQDPLDAIAEAFLEAQRLGEDPDIETFARSHPDQAERIRALFPLIQAMEVGKASLSETAPTPAARLGNQAIAMPDRLGEFTLLHEIGRGGMGVVYDAVQESLDRHVALKVLPGELTGEPSLLARFQRETRMIARLEHDHIVPVYSVGFDEDVHYFAMKLVRGVGLDRLLAYLALTPEHADRPLGDLVGALRNGTELPTEGPRVSLSSEMTRVVRSIADALAHAHAQGILHRDVKLSNVLVDEQGKAWLTDFGLARATAGGSITASGVIPGTIRYMAPELFDGEQDERSDIYSLGLVLLEMLTRKVAFSERQATALISSIVRGVAMPPPEDVPDVPPELLDVVQRAVAFAPEDRYQSAGEMAEDLARLEAGERPVASLVLEAHRPSPLGLAILVAVLLLALLLGYVVTHPPLPDSGDPAALKTPDAPGEPAGADADSTAPREPQDADGRLPHPAPRPPDPLRLGPQRPPYRPPHLRPRRLPPPPPPGEEVPD